MEKQTGHHTLTLTEICALLGEHKLPSWQDLPEIELYMDQVLSLVERYLGGYPGFDDRGLTASMVNLPMSSPSLVCLPAPRRYRSESLEQTVTMVWLTDPDAVNESYARPRSCTDAVIASVAVMPALARVESGISESIRSTRTTLAFPDWGS